MSQQDIEFLNKYKKSNIVPTHCKLEGRKDVSPAANKSLKNTEGKLPSRSKARCHWNRRKINKISKSKENEQNVLYRSEIIAHSLNFLKKKVKQKFKIIESKILRTDK